MRFKKKYQLVAIFLYSFAFTTVGTAQTNSNSLYDFFDKTVGKNNLGINNGKIHINTLRSFNETHRYFGMDKYRTGNVFYDGQQYDNVSLKYDLLNDILIYKIDGTNNNVGIDLISQKTAGFLLDGKKFVNLNYMAKPTEAFVKGFYEEFAVSELALYTKYSKAKVEILQHEGIFYRFEQSTDFIFRYKSNYYRLNDAKSIAAVLPEMKKNIDDYYEMNAAMERTDKVLFMKNLIKYLNNFMPKSINK